MVNLLGILVLCLAGAMLLTASALISLYVNDLRTHRDDSANLAVKARSGELVRSTNEVLLRLGGDATE
jgi:hypothetical protein